MTEPTGPAGEREQTLRDDPVDQDTLGPHKKVADAIVDLVEHEMGGRAIALEGSWGSGKSSVVRMVTDRYSSDPNRKVVVFDAWAHDGDPLRRSFLESLIEECEDWLPSRRKRTHWRNEREKLSGRQRTAVTETSPKLKWPAVVLGVLVLAVPLGATLLGAGLQPDVSDEWSKGGAALMLAPAVFAFVAWALTGFKNPGITTSNTTRERSQSSESVDPTSVEFQRLFNKFVDHVLGGSGHDVRRLILVLDNLDRVDSDTAKSILATMQTFLSLSEPKNADELSVRPRVWLLIPYDGAGMRQIWKEATPDSIDKIFQVQFRVPPIPVSDWRRHLRELLVEANVTSDEEAEAVYQTVDAYRRNPAPDRNGTTRVFEPTPRRLKLLTNRIVALGHQAEKPTPSASHRALFALLLRDDVDVELGLRAGSLASQSWVVDGQTDKALREDLAALYYNTDRERAQQLLLEEPLSDALRARADDTVEELATNPGFQQVLEVLPFEEWSVTELGGALLVIDLVADRARQTHRELDLNPNHFERAVVRSVVARDALVIAGADVGAALGTILLERGQSLLTCVHKLNLPPDGDVDGHVRGVLGFLAGVLPSLDPASEITIGNDYQPDEVMRLVQILRDEGHPDYWKFFANDDEAGPVAERIATEMRERPEHAAVLIGVLATVESSVAWEQVGIAVRENLALEERPVVVPSADALYLFAHWAPQEVRAAYDSGHLLVAFHLAENVHVKARVAFLCVTQENRSISLPAPPPLFTEAQAAFNDFVGDPGNSPDLMAALFEVVAENDALNALRTFADAGQRELLGHFLRTTVVPDPSAFFRPSTVRSWWQQDLLLFHLVPGDRIKVITGASSGAGLAAYFGSPLTEDEASFGLAVLEAANTEHAIAKDRGSTCAWVSDLFEGMTPEAWNEHLNAFDSVAELAVQLTLFEGARPLRSDLGGGYVDLTEKIADGAITSIPETIMDLLGNLTFAFEDGTVRREVILKMAGRTSPISPTFFDAIGPSLLEGGRQQLREVEGPLVVIAKKVITDHNYGSFPWVESVIGVGFDATWELKDCAIDALRQLRSEEHPRDEMVEGLVRIARGAGGDPDSVYPNDGAET